VQAISVLTCPQRPQYLSDTMDALEFAGARACDMRLLMHDGPMAPVRKGWCSFEHTRPQGALAAMWWVLGVAELLGVDRLIYCEDDIMPSVGAVARIMATPILPDQALVSFFDAKEFPGAKRFMEGAAGVLEVPLMGQDGKGLFGACCLLLPRQTIKWALRVRPGAPGMPEHADQALSWALRDSPWPVRGVSIPSLVEHVGDVSSMGHKAGQRAAYFAG